jgi:hypothetical protein
MVLSDATDDQIREARNRREIRLDNAATELTKATSDFVMRRVFL